MCNKTVRLNSHKEKGKALEDLIEYTINSLKGLTVYDRDVRTKSEEIDLIVLNTKTHPNFTIFDNIILVECKNWTKPVNSETIDHFLGILTRKGLSNGILVAANGVTGNINKDAVSIINGALQNKIRIIVLTMKDLTTIQKHDDIYAILLKKHMQLFLGKII
jgi:predicted Mrr-cat superfamily restriction endonuclease